jgi:hypothetical protein
VSDYSTLSDHNIRVLVAKTAGYRVVKLEDKMFYMLDPNKTIEQVTRALQYNFYAARSYSIEEKAWEFDTRYPNYPKSMDSCWLLYCSFGLGWTLYNTEQGYCCSISGIDRIEALAGTPARVMCEAFLCWNATKID